MSAKMVNIWLGIMLFFQPMFFKSMTKINNSKLYSKSLSISKTINDCKRNCFNGSRPNNVAYYYSI